MLETYFSAPKTLRRLRGGISGPHIDAFADDLERQGYAPSSSVRYIRAASHLGCFVQRKGGVLKDIDLTMLDSFRSHLRRCRCPHFKRGKISYHAQFGVKLFHHHLVGRGICPSESVPNLAPHPPLVVAFCDWFRTHRGVKEPTLRHYARGATDLLRALGEDVEQVECTGRSRFSSAASQPVWDTDNTGADHFPPRVSAVPQLLWRIPRRSRPRDTRCGALAAGEVATLFVSGRSRPVDRRVQRHRSQAASRSGDLTHVGAIRIARRRCGVSPSHRHRLEQRHAAGNGERAIPGAVATPAGCRRRFAPLSGMPARQH